MDMQVRGELERNIKEVSSLNRPGNIAVDRKGWTSIGRKTLGLLCKVGNPAGREPIGRGIKSREPEVVNSEAQNCGRKNSIYKAKLHSRLINKDWAMLYELNPSRSSPGTQWTEEEILQSRSTVAKVVSSKSWTLFPTRQQACNCFPSYPHDIT